MRFKATCAGESIIEYAIDAARAWCSSKVGRPLKWVKAADGMTWYGFAGAPPGPGGPFDGALATIISSDHANF